MTSSVTIDGLVFSGDGSDENWIYERLQGWYSGAPVQGDSENYPNSDGASAIDVAYRAPRPLRFNGTLAAESTVEAIQRWMQFAAIQADGRPFPLTVIDPLGIPLTVTVSLNGAAEVDEINNQGAEVSARFIAYDPVKYGVARDVITGLSSSGGGLEYPLHSGGGAVGVKNFATNPFFETVATGVAVETAGGGTWGSPALITTSAVTPGVGAVRYTLSAATSSVSALYVNASIADLVTADDFFYAVWVRTSVAATIRARAFSFANADGTGAATAHDGADVVLTAGAWSLLTVAATVAAGRLSVRPAIRIATNVASGATVDITGVLIKKGLPAATLVRQVDWVETEHGSASVIWDVSAPTAPHGTLFYGANGDLGRATLTNSGTARVWPSVVLKGGLTAGFFVQRLDTGQVVRYDRIVPEGSTVTINFRTGAVLIDGLSDGSTYLTRYEFFSVGPGESIEVQFNAIGGSTGKPTATLTIADGYW